ncbi:MAG: hypothetical protein C4617_02175 [Candidatus Liberibacter europaeus]|uniref:Uncharacterized protein n=1 Tax=Candidatus Liberibacter europaeus TaxID=744859 RepID=A0A2T4VXZ4_9HYPH|nr:hypothetical protein [Candidatus Liberibacter europaeus]PTL86645.1 MAG: hypothetical protein C4617_02175 [Candidatus Liberibacter europaeus]
MEVSSVKSNIDSLQDMDKGFSSISRDGSYFDSFQSFFEDNSIHETSSKSIPIPDVTQKLQGIMFQYFTKSILPDETVKSLGGGFYGDFWKEILAYNISNAIVKQHKIDINLQ